MIATSSQLKIYLILTPQDLRKSFNGLGAIVESDLGHKLADQALYIFTNKTRTRIKLLQFDGSLLCVLKIHPLRDVLFLFALPSKNYSEGLWERL